MKTKTTNKKGLKMALSKNTKVDRMLSALAIVVKDEKLSLIMAMDRVINDDQDGYGFNFTDTAVNARTWVQGKSY